MTAPLTLPAHERAQTLKVVDRLEDRADLYDQHVKAIGKRIDAINSQIAKLQADRRAERGYLQDYMDWAENIRHAVEMLSAELEGDTDSTWRAQFPDAAKAEEHAHASIEKQDTQAFREALCLRDETGVSP
ncbi:hypothetical protein [Henriciella sp.]|uniref:hypothetical protein n=1 Tax=Henriciella sp. TaxID=1968823 RepID=UPI000C119284|nr:hypothetical protein [Henriciella sp.]PHR83130.1 MAG: hypothetical protein COA64_00295 [Henriciella sp.]